MVCLLFYCRAVASQLVPLLGAPLGSLITFGVRAVAINVHRKPFIILFSYDFSAREFTTPSRLVRSVRCSKTCTLDERQRTYFAP